MFLQLPWASSLKPQTGHVYANRWWFVGDEGPLFYRQCITYTPQCNVNKAVLEQLQTTSTFYASYEIKKLTLVFLGDNYKAHLVSGEEQCEHLK
jgi:hypothetical protein